MAVFFLDSTTLTLPQRLRKCVNTASISTRVVPSSVDRGQDLSSDAPGCTVTDSNTTQAAILSLFAPLTFAFGAWSAEVHDVTALSHAGAQKKRVSFVGPFCASDPPTHTHTHTHTLSFSRCVYSPRTCAWQRYALANVIVGSFVAYATCPGPMTKRVSTHAALADVIEKRSYGMYQYCTCPTLNPTRTPARLVWLCMWPQVCS